MIPDKFEYFTPQTLDEAIALLKQYGDQAKILSGGHSLIPMMKLRFATPEVLIDINGIPGLDYIKEEDGFLIVRLVNTPTIARLYSSSPRRSAVGLHS